MSQNFTINGVIYPYPDVDDQEWGQEATDWANAVTNGMLQKAGGSFTLTADVDFGATYGLKTSYYKSRATNPASAGQVRLGNTESVSWRNAANNADLSLSVNSSNQITFAGNPIISGTALTASRTVVTDGSGVLSVSATTSTEIGYVNGVTSAIQAQINAKLSLAGGTMTGPLVIGGLSGAQVPLILDNGTSTGSIFIAQYNGNNVFTIDSGGAVGIGVDTPSSALDIAGDITLSTGSNRFVYSLSSLSMYAADNIAIAYDLDNSGVGSFSIRKSGTSPDFTISNSGIATFTQAPVFSSITTSRALITNGSSALAASATTSTELGYVSGVTSAIQTQINTKAPTASPTFSGTITTPLTASRALTTGASSELAVSSVTSTELGYVSGVTSAIQTQLTARLPLAGGTMSGALVIGGLSGSAIPLIADNGSSTGSIFIGKDNGTAVFTIADGGASTFTQALTVTGASVTVGASGTSGKFSARATNGTDSAFFGFTIGQTQISTTNADGIVFVSNVSIGANSTPTYGGGSSAVMMIQDASVAPSSNPTGGGILYSQAGALKWRGSSGTVTTIAVA